MARCAKGIRPTQDALQPLEALDVSLGERGIFARIMVGLAAEHGEETTVMIDATHLKAHRTASSLGVKKGGVGV